MARVHYEQLADIFQSPSKECRHNKRTHNEAIMRELLQHTTPSLSPDDRRFLDSPFTAQEFY